MKRHLLIFLMLTAIGGASAQVSVRIDQGALQPIDTTGGLYFAGDTLRVVTSAGDTTPYAMDDITMVTFQLATQGIDPVRNSDLSLYPVPTSRYVTVNGIGATPQQVTVYNTAGMQVMQQTATDGTQIDVQQLPAGTYVLRCGNMVSKIIKQ